MFIGHFAVAMLVKSYNFSLPVWVLGAAAQMPDLLAFVLIALGVENFALDLAHTGKHYYARAHQCV